MCTLFIRWSTVKLLNIDHHVPFILNPDLVAAVIILYNLAFKEEQQMLALLENVACSTNNNMYMFLQKQLGQNLYSTPVIFSFG